jgi:hypothetical protein
MLEEFDDPCNDEMGGTVLSGYDTAQICLNGHPINSTAEGYPQFNTKFCKECGAETITACPKCRAKIRGDYHSTGVFGAGAYEPPRYCHECGSAYPWLESSLSSAREYIRELDRLDDNEKGLLSRSLDDLVRETPNTTVAALRFKKLVAKAGSTAADVFNKVLAGVIVEAAKREIWP